MTTPNITILHDMVMIRPMPLALKKTATGVILPGDIDKMAPKRATVIAAGPGKYKKDIFVPNPIKVSDNILYMERDLIPVKVDGEDFFMLKAEDVIVKLGRKDFGPNDTLPELSDSEYYAETLRRKLIAKLKAAGLTRVQDMLNPVETYITQDGETIPVTARSFLLDEETLDEPFSPEEGVVAFAMYKVNYVEAINPVTPATTVRVVIQLGFLTHSDVTLG